MSPPGRSQGEFRSAQQGCLMLPRPGARQERHATGLRRQGRHADAAPAKTGTDGEWASF